MPYTIENPPEWLKNLPDGAVKIGVEVFNSVAKSGDEDKARMAAWAAIKAKYEKKESGEWQRKATQDRESQQILRFRAAMPKGGDGLKWEAVLIVPGLSLSDPQFFWSEELLAASAPVFEGVDINAYELTADFFMHLPIPNIGLLEDVKRYLAAKKVGWIEKAWFEAGVGIKAIIQFLPDQEWLPNMLQSGHARGNDDVLGLSIDTRIKGIELLIDGRSVIWPTEIVSCSSVDVVTHPAAGGKFLRAVAGLDKPTNNPASPEGFAAVKEEKMDREKLLNLIQKIRPELLEGKDRAALSEDEILAMAQMAMTPKTDKKPGDDDAVKRAAQAVTKDEMALAIKKATEEQELRAACSRMLDSTLAADTTLPDLTRQRIRSRFENTVFEQAALDAAVKGEKDYLASMAAPPAFDFGNQSRISVGIGGLARARMAIDRLFGFTKADMLDFVKIERLDRQPFFQDLRAAQAKDYDEFDRVPAFSSLYEMYLYFTGDTEVSGRFNRAALSADLRASQDINSSTFTYALGNTLARRIVKDYRETNYQEDLLISVRKPVKDFRTQEAVNIGYFGDIDDVDPESGDYQEIGAITDEEATYTLGQKGNLLTVTRKTIINDDVSVITRAIGRVGRAIRRTHAKYVWNFFINNSNCSDGTAWFTSGHGNLGASALTIATALVAYLALASMTEKDSGEKIGWLDNPAVKPVLVYPIALLQKGEDVVNEEFYYASNDLTTKTRNPLKGKITGAMISLLSDTDDWGMFMPPGEADLVEMGYLHGKQEPEVFVADTPQSEQVFVADKVRYKYRHEYAGTPVAYQGGYKTVV